MTPTTDRPMKDELLPCPFCGSPAITGTYYIECSDREGKCPTDPKVDKHHHSFDEAKAIAAWNTRQSPQRGVQDGVEKLRSLAFEAVYHWERDATTVFFENAMEELSKLFPKPHTALTQPSPQSVTIKSDNTEVIIKLQAFKDYVHKRLDAAGIPTHPNGEHSQHGCRIGDRLDIALAQPSPQEGKPISDLVAQKFKACGEVNIPTRERMGLPEKFAQMAKQPVADERHTHPTPPAGALTEGTHES